MDDENRNRDDENNISGDQAFQETIGDMSKDKSEVPSTSSTDSMDIDATAPDSSTCEEAKETTLQTDNVSLTTPSSPQKTTEMENPSEEPPTVPEEKSPAVPEEKPPAVPEEKPPAVPEEESPAAPVEEPPAAPVELVNIKIIYNKKKFDHSIDINRTILDLKHDIEKLTGVPVATQKVMFKGSTQDDQTLQQLKVTKSANKFMVIGSTMNDLLKVAAPDPKSLTSEKEEKSTASSKEPYCKQTAHKKVLDKHGKPDDVTVGIKGSSLPLPTAPLSGMYNKYGGKTRLTFKLDADELWIGTKERTQKVKMGSIKDIASQPIEGHEEYHIMGIQLGTTEASKYWIYWVPAQYINAIKDTVLGKWGEF